MVDKHLDQDISVPRTSRTAREHIDTARAKKKKKKKGLSQLGMAQHVLLLTIGVIDLPCPNYPVTQISTRIRMVKVLSIKVVRHRRA